MDTTTYGTVGEGRINHSSNITGNRTGMDRVEEEGEREPPKTRGDRPRTPGGGQGNQIEEGGRTDSNESEGGATSP